MENETSEASENIKATHMTLPTVAVFRIPSRDQGLDKHMRQFPPAEVLLPNDMEVANEAMNMVNFPKYFSLISFPFQCF